MLVIDEIAAERRRQIEAEGWSPDHDDTHSRGELARAAASYTLRASGHDAIYAAIGLQPLSGRNAGWIGGARLFWPWSEKWWKPTTPRRDLIKAAALIVAEIERLDRLPASAGAPALAAGSAEASREGQQT